MGGRREHPAKGWAGTYGRVSKLQADVNQGSPENQARLNRQAAILHGLKIKPDFEFDDHGKSASKATISRRNLERGMNAVVGEKAIEALVVPAVDRLSRLGMRHVGEMLDAVDGVGGRIIFVKEALDSSEPTSRAIIAFLSEQARAEASNVSWRVEVWHEGARIKGKWTGKRPYGFKVVDGKLASHPGEAPIVRRMVADYLGGGSLLSIAKALNAEGIPSPNAAKAIEMIAEGRETKYRPDSPWSGSAVSIVLHNPALVGWQRHKQGIVLGPDGDPVSFGEGILAPGEHARVLAALEKRSVIVGWEKSRRAGTKVGAGRLPRHLLTGIARCPGCGYAMYGQPGSGPNANYYRCSSFISGHPCPAAAQIKEDRADAEVMRQVRMKLAAMEPGDPMLDAITERWREVMLPEGEDERAVFQTRLDAVRGRIVDLEEARYVRGDFTTPDDLARWDRMMARLKAQRDAVIEDLDELGPPPDFDLNTLRTMFRNETWDTTPLAQRRTWLGIAVSKVTVSRAYRRPLPADERVRVFLVGERKAE